MVENPYMGLVFVGTDARILLINQTYCDIVGVSKDKAMGRHIHEVTPNSLMPEILRTQETHLADLWQVNGHDMIVTRTPIYDNGRLIGALGRTLFLNLSSAKIMASKLAQTEGELAVYREELKKIHKAKYFLNDLIGQSATMMDVKQLACQVGKTVCNVLITGETGTGKELLANAIHNVSNRSGQPFIRVNCASLSNSLLESELFGYEDGAFTGARKGGKPGRFEMANRGTVFLDEVGDIPLDMQAKLLTFLQEREFERVGGTKTIRVDVKVIAATNTDLESLAEEGRFRRDLYYRLNVVNIHIPPLKRRMDDIPELAQFFLQKLNAKLKTDVRFISNEVIRLLMSYNWPGNVRELENVMERAIVVADMDEERHLEVKHLPGILRRLKGANMKERDASLRESLTDVEKQAILDCLKRNNQDKVATAKELGIHLSVLYRKMNKYDIMLGKKAVQSRSGRDGW
jgi:PAS domain S-box-containing protein